MNSFPQPPSGDHRDKTAIPVRLQWYLDAHFGMFIHWGAYSVAGVEASWPLMTPDLAPILFPNPNRISEEDYVALPSRFNPVEFDARGWVRLAKRAGMRYIVFTAKHHDGFCMFDAPGTDYKITNTPFGRDVCKELADACAEEGMRLGFYYSPPDMHHPGYRDTRKPVAANWTGEPRRAEWQDYLDYMASHLRTLLTGYGPISVIWFDGLFNHRKYDPPRFHRLIHAISPDTLINDRLGDGYDFITPEQFIPRQGIPIRTGKPPAAEKGGEGWFRTVLKLIKTPLVGKWLRKQLERYATGELELTRIPQAPYPEIKDFQPWETCMTMGSTWAYNPHEEHWKPVDTLIRNLVEVTSRGGNYLLNIGPTPQGTFPPPAVERLEAIGRWMEVHSDAIYGTTYLPPLAWQGGRATRKGNRIYLHIFEWSHDGKLIVGDFPFSVGKVESITGEGCLFRQSENQLEIDLPPQPFHQPVSVLVVSIT